MPAQGGVAGTALDGLQLQPPPEQCFLPNNAKLTLKYIHFSGQS